MKTKRLCLIFIILISVSFTGEVFSAEPRYGGEKSLDVDRYGGLESAILAIGATEMTVVVTTAQTLTANRELVSTLSVIILNGGSINGAYTLTINGPFDAGLYQVFGASVTIVFGNGSVKEVYPEWWGAKADNLVGSATLNTTALTSAWATGCPIKLNAGIYQFTGPLNAAIDRFTLKGQGKLKSRLLNIGVAGEEALTFNCDYIQIQNVEIIGNVSSGSGIEFDDSSTSYTGKHIELINVNIISHGSHGIEWVGGEDRYSSYVNITDCWIGNNVTHAIYSDVNQTINTIIIKGTAISGSAAYVANGSEGVKIAKGHTLAILGSSLQSFVYGINYGYGNQSYGFISHSNYFESFTEAGINLGGVGAVNVMGFDIRGDYYNLDEITNVTVGAGVRITSGFGAIGSISYTNNSATKKIIVTTAGNVLCEDIYDPDITSYSFDDDTRVIVKGKLQTIGLSGVHIANWSQDERTGNLYGVGSTTYYFHVPAKYMDYIERFRVRFYTDNADATAVVTMYKSNLENSSAGTSIATDTQIGDGLLSIDVGYRIENKHAVIVKVVVTDDGAGGLFTYVYAPHVFGSF